MGDLNQPVNTFWQLLHRPAGATTWTDQVEAIGVATTEDSCSPPHRVGLSPSECCVQPPHLLPARLHVNAGKAWSNGLLTDGLAADPNVLASGPAGQILALTDRPPVPRRSRARRTFELGHCHVGSHPRRFAGGTRVSRRVAHRSRLRRRRSRGRCALRTGRCGRPVRAQWSELGALRADSSCVAAPRHSIGDGH